MTPEKFEEPIWLEAVREESIEKVTAFLDTLPDKTTKRAELLRLIDWQEDHMTLLHDDREKQDDLVSDEARRAAASQIEEDRKNPDRFLGKLEILLKSY